MNEWDLTTLAVWCIKIERSRFAYDRAEKGNYFRPRRWTQKQLRRIYDEAFAGSRMFKRVSVSLPAPTERIGEPDKRANAHPALGTTPTGQERYP